MLKMTILAGACLLCTGAAADTCRTEYNYGVRAFERAAGRLKEAQADYDKYTRLLNAAIQDRSQICRAVHGAKSSFNHTYKLYHSSSTRFTYAVNECDGENKASAKLMHDRAEDWRDYAREQELILRDWIYEYCS